MALEDLQQRYIPRENSFYRNYYHWIIIGISGAVFLLICMILLLLYQVYNKPLPVFAAQQPNGKSIALTPYDLPNIQPDVITRFAAQAATVAYTYNFANYQDQLNAARPYFTENGWNDYRTAVDPTISQIVSKQLILNGVVSSPPTINNQGLLNGVETWRVAVPFLATIQSSGATETRTYMVLLTIVRVPTNINKRGIGIDQFIMYVTGTGIV